jgi:hypothetical protein
MLQLCCSSVAAKRREQGRLLRPYFKKEVERERKRESEREKQRQRRREGGRAGGRERTAGGWRTKTKIWNEMLLTLETVAATELQQSSSRAATSATDRAKTENTLTSLYVI